jgi:hypothetical protein
MASGSEGREIMSLWIAGGQFFFARKPGFRPIPGHEW